MNLPELQRISEDELRKIYPTKYYGKYARHVVLACLLRMFYSMSHRC